MSLEEIKLSFEKNQHYYGLYLPFSPTARHLHQDQHSRHVGDVLHLMGPMTPGKAGTPTLVHTAPYLQEV